MAHSTTTQHAVGTALRYAYQPSFVDAVFRNNMFLGLHLNGNPVFPQLPTGDTYYRWKLNSAGNSAAVFTEGASAPAPGAQTYVNAYVAYTYFWCWCRITGHVRDVAGDPGAMHPGLNVVENEFLGGFEDIRDLMNTSFMGGTYGLEAAVDDGNTWAGITRGSAGYFECSNTNQNGALTRAGLLNTQEAQRDNDKGGITHLILAPHNQLTNYLQLTGEPNAQNSSIRLELALAGGKGMDIAPNPMAMSFMGAPIVGVPDFTNTTWVGLDLRRTRVGPNCGVSIRRDFDVRGPDMSGDDDVFELSSAAAFIVHDPAKCWKIEDATA